MRLFPRRDDDGSGNRQKEKIRSILSEMICGKISLRPSGQPGYVFIHCLFPGKKPDQLASFVTRDLAPHVMCKDLMLKVELPPKK
jgi:hypothetical protein